MVTKPSEPCTSRDTAPAALFLNAKAWSPPSVVKGVISNRMMLVAPISWFAGASTASIIPATGIPSTLRLEEMTLANGCCASSNCTVQLKASCGSGGFRM